MTELSDTLLRARHAAGLTQREVADALGVPHVYPSRWERAVVRPEGYQLKSLARLLGLDEARLLRLRSLAPDRRRRGSADEPRPARTEGLRIEMRTTTEAGTIHVAFAGELDPTGAGLARAALEAACSLVPRVLVLDLTGLSFMDSTGADLVVDGGRRAAACGARFVAVGGTGAARRVLTLLGVTEDLELAEDIESITGSRSAGDGARSEVA